MTNKINTQKEAINQNVRRVHFCMFISDLKWNVRRVHFCMFISDFKWSVTQGHFKINTG